MKFELSQHYQAKGDQPKAIELLSKSLQSGNRDQTLLGVTGSGKTFTMANIVANLQRPTLVVSHNKTLAAQLASEFREFFPNNAVHYFVSFYDYYQPESYLPRTDTYIEKTTQLNEEIERLRHAATTALLSRRDVLIVASVSCIYGLGSPEAYKASSFTLETHKEYERRSILKSFINMRYMRNEITFARGTFRVKGEVIEIFPATSEHTAYRIQFFGDAIERIEEFHALTGEVESTPHTIDIYPASHYVTPTENVEEILQQIHKDMVQEVAELRANGKPLEAYRLEQRTSYDIEMIRETGFVNGIENYSRYFDRRKIGEPPYTLLDYFPDDYLTFIDESHITLSQIRGMYRGDQARKQTLVNYGFRLKAALDNRPLRYEEFSERVKQFVYVSATPQTYEIERSAVIAEQIIRPTGLLDPQVEVRSKNGQIEYLIKNIEERVARKERVLITTLTKRMAEELTEFLQEKHIAVRYLHSEIDTLERLEILRDLRLGVFDVLVGINLLREGLDLPEVSLVAILDADKEGFLRSTSSLIQTIGRAARHEQGKVIMFADRVTDSMKTALEETNRRRAIQEAYNTKHGITPETIIKVIRDDRLSGQRTEEIESTDVDPNKLSNAQREWLLDDLTKQMQLAAENLNFEQAAALRDEINRIKKA